MPSASQWRHYPQTYRYEAARCRECGTVHFPPRLICRKCSTREFETFEMKRTGKVVTHTLIRTPGDEFAGQAPFGIAVVELDDGVRLTAQVADASPEEIRTGLPVRLEFRRVFSEGDSGVIHYGYKAVPVRQ